jgi:hypothetical protein
MAYDIDGTGLYTFFDLLTKVNILAGGLLSIIIVFLVFSVLLIKIKPKSDALLAASFTALIMSTLFTYAGLITTSLYNIVFILLLFTGIFIKIFFDD